LSRDVAFLTSTIIMAPGNVEYQYYNERVDISRYSFVFQDNSVKISSDGTIGTYPFPESDDINLDTTLIFNSRNIIFEKNGKNLMIRGDDG